MAHRVRVPWGGEGDPIDDDTRRPELRALAELASGRDDEVCRVTACGHRAQKIMRSRVMGHSGMCCLEVHVGILRRHSQLSQSVFHPPAASTTPLRGSTGRGTR